MRRHFFGIVDALAARRFPGFLLRPVDLVEPREQTLIASCWDKEDSSSNNSIVDDNKTTSNDKRVYKKSLFPPFIVLAALLSATTCNNQSITTISIDSIQRSRKDGTSKETKLDLCQECYADTRRRNGATNRWRPIAIFREWAVVQKVLPIKTS